MSVVSFSIMVKTAAAATIALIACAALSVAAGDGVARAQSLGSKNAQELCVFLIF